LRVKLTRRAQSDQEQGAVGKIGTQVKKTAQWGGSEFVLFATYYLGDIIEDEMDGAFAHMGKMKSIKNVGKKM